MNDQMTYEEQLAAEAEVWGTEAEKMAAIVPPDWRYHRNLRHMVILNGPEIEGMLSLIRPGMKTVELGCASGWLTLAMAQKGAHAEGWDLSQKSLTIAQNYYDSIKDEVSGTVTYHLGDINRPFDLPKESYDVVVVKGTLHHLLNPEEVVSQLHAALKPGGLFWADDFNGHQTLLSALLAGATCFVLPTHTSYAEKFKALLKFGLKTPSRVLASMHSDGLSPFEGAGREHDWLVAVQKLFRIEKQVSLPDVSGYVGAQTTLPDSIAMPFLKAFRAFERLIIRLNLLHSTGIVVYARK